jgi:hypothetical protein
MTSDRVLNFNEMLSGDSRKRIFYSTKRAGVGEDFEVSTHSRKARFLPSGDPGWGT